MSSAPRGPSRPVGLDELGDAFGQLHAAPLDADEHQVVRPVRQFHFYGHMSSARDRARASRMVVRSGRGISGHKAN